uniref:K Homology domain-containing protein n=1 Tax=Lutzomyia longipalpis TaxID=7200 RepID=A0A1B0GIH9_LUTLO
MAQMGEEFNGKVEKIGEDYFRMIFHVPSAFYGHIIGQGGATLRLMEEDTRTIIRLPKPGTDDMITVKGRRVEYLEAARNKIYDIVDTYRTRGMTHFFSINCATEAVKEAYGKFKEAVQEAYSPEGLPEIYFQKPEKLHITLSGMLLNNDQDRQMAVDLLHGEEEAIRKIMEKFPGKAHIKIQGLMTMNDNPEKAKVLYARIHSEALEEIAEHLDRLNRKSGLYTGSIRKTTVQLHMTLMNVAYDKDDNGRFKKGNTINAKKILEDFGDYSFGEVPLTEIHLSQRKSYDDDGYYTAFTKLFV